MSLVFAVMYREYRIRTSGLMWMFFDLLVPMTYLLLFGIGLDRAFTEGVTTQGSAVPYDAFFLAGVVAMANFGIAINTSYGFFVDRDNGIFYEFLTYPMTRGQLLVGKIVFNCLLSLVQGVLTLLLGVLILKIEIQWEMLPLVLISIVLATAGWFFALSTIALRIRRNDVFNTLLNMLYFVLMFTSTLFYPLDGAPSWLHTASMVNPLTWHTDVLRFATIGLGTPATILWEAGAFCVFVFAGFWFAVRTLQTAVLK
ncbi:MAG: ABC transporter permease [Bacteroidota bacterium]